MTTFVQTQRKGIPKGPSILSYRKDSPARNVLTSREISNYEERTSASSESFRLPTHEDYETKSLSGIQNLFAKENLVKPAFEKIVNSPGDTYRKKAMLKPDTKLNYKSVSPHKEGKSHAHNFASQCLNIDDEKNSHNMFANSISSIDRHLSTDRIPRNDTSLLKYHSNVNNAKTSRGCLERQYSSKKKENCEKENSWFCHIFETIMAENKNLIQEILRLKGLGKSNPDAKDKVHSLVAEIEKLKVIIVEKEEEVSYWKKKSSSVLDLEKYNEDMTEKVKSLERDNQKLNELILMQHNDTIYFKKQLESYIDHNKDFEKIHSEALFYKIDNQKLNQELFENNKLIEGLQKELDSIKKNNECFSNEIAKKNDLVEILKQEVSQSKRTINSCNEYMSNRSGQRESEIRKEVVDRRSGLILPI